VPRELLHNLTEQAIAPLRRVLRSFPVFTDSSQAHSLALLQLRQSKASFLDLIHLHKYRMMGALISKGYKYSAIDDTCDGQQSPADLRRSRRLCDLVVLVVLLILSNVITFLGSNGWLYLRRNGDCETCPRAQLGMVVSHPRSCLQHLLMDNSSLHVLGPVIPRGTVQYV
jgi:hypothetical protein